MFRFTSGVVAVAVLCATVFVASARVSSVSAEQNLATDVESNNEERFEENYHLKSASDKSSEDVMVDDGETIVTGRIESENGTTKEYSDIEDSRKGREEGWENYGIDDLGVTEMEEDLEVKNKQLTASKTIINIPENNFETETTQKLVKESSTTETIPGYDEIKSSVSSELMSSEVQVEDFMKSRVAYHNAILADVKESKTDSSRAVEASVYLKDENLGTPEKLTMEETIGEIWRETPKKEINGFLSQNKNNKNDMKLNDHQEYYEKPTAYKLTMKDSDRIEETEDVPTEQVTENEAMGLLTTDTTVKQATNTVEPISPNLIHQSETEILEEENSAEYSSRNESLEITTTLKSENETEEQCSNTTDTADDIISNEPVAERLYAFGTENESKANLNNKIEYNSLSDRKAMPSQSFRDYKDISEEDLVDIQNLLPDHPSFKKEKIEPGVLYEECVDCDFRVLPIRPSEQRDSPKMEEESLPASTIRFPDPPEGRELQIYSLGLSDGFFLFGYLSEFLSWIQPNEFPVDLLRDALRSQITWISLITQSLQVEAGFVACLVLGVLLALAVPVVVLSHACYRMTSHDDDDADDKVGWAGNCRRRTLVFILQILLVLLMGGMVAMFVTNEQLSDAVVKSSDVIQTSLSDVSAFVHNSHLQIHFLVTQSLDQALNAVYADLDNVDSLLGRPMQRELIRETGIDVALESLADLTRVAKETTQQVDRLLDEVREVQEMVVSTRDKLSDLRQQVELFRRACGPRDRALCDTIDASGLDVKLRLDRLKSDERLHRMRRMGGVGLETAVAEAKELFTSVPSRVETDTRDAREAARRQLMRQRADVDDRSLALERLVRDMTGKVSDAKYAAGFWMQDLDQFEYWRWIVCMGGGAAVLMVWTMLLCSLCCGCCGSEKAAGPTILVTIVLVCLLSTALWSVALVGMLFGGHGEVFVCRPLYDEPEYHVLSRLVDQPGVFYSEPRGGFIANVIYGNDTLDVPIRQVLEECRGNRGLYPTLGLGRVFDVEAAVDQHRWSSATMQLRSVRANLSSLQVLSPALQDQLSDLLATLSVNFTEHRIEMSRPVTGKDMDSFARQLDNVGNQMRDLAVASRMETLSTRTRRLIDSHIRPLEGRKDALVYQLTALEVQTGPLQRQVNQSLSHLKTIQFFINSQGETIAQRKSRQYVDRLLGYVDQLRRHVVESLGTSVAPCRPLWDIFNTTRLFLCRHTMDPLNGFWFASMWCLIVLLVATPVCLKLVDYYRAQGYRSSGSPSENLVISEQGAAWSSPGYDIKSKDQCNGNDYYK